jgi:hypothetical protein
MAYPSPRRLQLRRGNASAISSYLGYAGELVVDTSNWTLYVHDGVTVGGYAATVNTASISGNINSILNGTAVFGNIIPSANTVYSLGNITHQWKSLFVSNSTIYVGGVPLSIDATGNLTVNGNIIPTIGYVNASVANVVVDLSSYALNANVTAANVGLKGYVDQANTIQSSQLTSANLGIIGYVDLANTIQSAQISAANIGIIGYIDQANTIQSAQVNAANLAITAANLGLKGYVDQANTIQSQQIAAANVGIIGYIDSQSFYSNVKVETYLQSGNIANVSVAGNVTATYFVGNGALLTGIAASSSYSNVQTAAYLATATINTTGNITAGNLFTSGALYVANITTTGASGNISGANYITANYFVGNGALLTGITAGSSYSNVQVATYLPTYDGVVTAGNVAVNGNVTAQYFLGNGAFLTGIVGGAGNYGNIDVKAFLETDAGPGDGFQRVIEGYYSNIILGDSTKLFSFGNSSKSYFGHDGFLGNASINYIRADNGDVRIATNNGAYAWIFDRNGNLTFPSNNLVIKSKDDTLGNAAVISSGNFVVILSNGASGGTTSLWAEDYANIGTSNIAAVYANPTVGSKIVRIAVGQNGGPYGPNLWDFGTNGTTQFPGSKILAPAGQSITMQSDNYSQLMWENANLTVAPNMAINSNFYVAQNNATLDIGYRDGSSTQIIKSWYWNADGTLTLPASSGQIGRDGYSNGIDLYNNNGGSGYVRMNYADQSVIWGDAGGAHVQSAGTYTWDFDTTGNLKLPSGGYILNSDDSIYGGGDYSNVQVAAYLNTASINTTGNITAQNLIGNISITGNVTGTSANVTLQAGAYTSVFDNQGNVRLPTAYVTGNVTANYFVGNGALLTGIAASSNYSNVNVATYLPTYSGNIANIRLGVAGVLTFADGTTQITAGGSSYSNVQVATYLPAYGGAIQSSNVQTTTANIQATTAATNPATGALRVMGGVGVAGTVFAGQLNTTGNLIANAISAYSLNTVANVVASVVNAGTINSAGNVLAQNLTGTLTTASQTNITAVGTLGALTVTGNATVGNLIGTEANTRIIANTYVTTFDIYGNVSFPGNVSATNFVGSGSLLSGVAIKTTGSWTVPTGNSTQSFTVPTSGTYQLWVDCNVPNGILVWNATATVTNSNVPVVGQQFAWVYNGGGTPIDFTSIPNQFVGTGNTIVRSSVSPSVTTNRFDFGINNTSGGNVTVSYGYVKIS